MVVIREQWAKCPVHQPGYEDLIVGRPCFTLQESSGEFSCCCIFLFVIYREWHKINIFFCFFCTDNSCQYHGVAHANHDGAIGLLGQDTGFYTD